MGIYNPVGRAKICIWEQVVRRSNNNKFAHRYFREMPSETFNRPFGRYFFNAPHIPYHLPRQHIPTAHPHMLFTYHITIPYPHFVLLNIWFLSFFGVVYTLTWRLLCWASQPVYAQCLRRQKISPTNMVGGRWIYWISPLFSEHYSCEPPTTRFVRWFFLN